MVKEGRQIKKEPFLDYDYVGPHRKKDYFEGWYLKLMVADKSIAMIPSLHFENGVRRGHLQWIVSDGNQQDSGSRSFASHQVTLQESPFVLKLGANEFKQDGFSISEDGLVLNGHFEEILPFGSNIMGPFAIFKNLPCIHGLQALSGKVSLSCQSSLFNGNFLADFYCEKDRGTTFPERYLWLHCYFPERKASLFFSIALIPLGPIHFEGHIANWFDGESNHTFATYYRTKVKLWENSPDQFVIELKNGDRELKIAVNQGALQELASPKDGAMADSVFESMDSQIELEVRNRKSGAIEKYSSNRCSLEVNAWFD